MLQSSAEILRFWFGEADNDSVVAQQQSALWWSKNPAVDLDIRKNFEATVLAAAAGSLDSWAKAASGRLVLILLTDQLPRNMYRGTPRAFAFDAFARHWCHSGLAHRVDLQLRPIQRVFFYLPLEHSELLEDQNLAVQLLDELAKSVEPGLEPLFADYLDFAQRHQAIIKRFGRFPHRNSVLNRVSTAEELEFLQQPGSSF